MSLRLRLTAVCTIAAALYAGNASAHPLNQHETPVAAPLVHLINWHRSQTWHYQDLLRRPRTPSSFAERETESTEFRSWQVGLWRERHLEVRKDWQAFLRSWIAQERNPYKAIRASASFWNVSYSWMVSCARSEGLGDGGSVIQQPNWAGAAGAFQFLRGTFYSYAPSAFRAAARQGVNIPRRYLSWGSNVGQAWTAGYMFSRGLSHHWVGAGC